MFREEERKNRRTYLSSKGADSSDPKLLLAEDFRSEAGFGGGVQFRSWLWRRSTLPKLVLGGRKKMTDPGGGGQAAHNNGGRDEFGANSYEEEQ